jgi:thymidylate synthase ThyX
MSYKVDILSDVVSPEGQRLLTIETSYPRFLHSEMLRHRMFSHSVASSRAIPTERLIDQVRNNPFIPETFNKRVKGMGVGDPLEELAAEAALKAWRVAAQEAADAAEFLMGIGLDKSRANRFLEPFLFVTDIITATEWDNFFALRDHPAAQLEFQKLARMIREAIEDSCPYVVNYGQWSLPLTNHDFPFDDGEPDWEHWKMVSASRCARVSFDNHTASEPRERTIERAERLIASGHLSPFEHVARPFTQDEWRQARWLEIAYRTECEKHYRKVDESYAASFYFRGNLRGWVQMRKEFPNEHRFDLITEGQTA